MEQTRGTETSQYPEEKISTDISLVAASEKETAYQSVYSGTDLESLVTQGDSPVHEIF